jgi:beta-lactamase regulating signal transducer with metallopeptidase domain/tetratricopeptide (TPR) repeat protein
MNEFIERLGWVLVHSLWQFTAVALLAGLTVLVLRRRSATLRYGLLVLAMAVSVAAPVATWFLVDVDASPDSLSGRESPIMEPVPDQAVDPVFDASRFVGDPLLSGPALDDSSPNSATNQVEPAMRPIAIQPEQTQRPNIEPAVSWLEQATMVLRPWLVWIVVVWGLGVVLCSARPLLGWRTLRRLRRVGSSPVPNDVLAAMQRVSERLGIRRSVQIFQSTLAQVPVVVGYLKPVVLLPVSLVTSVPASQLEAILAHELAHIRRHDFVVNLLQTLVETMFFYHPGVWWLSRQIRVEREHCCDDIVIAVLGDRVEYGRALVAIEQLRGKESLLALGVADGSLLSRVRRITGWKSERRDSSPSFVLTLTVCSIAMICAMSVVGWFHAGQETNVAIAADVVDKSKPTRAEVTAKEAKAQTHRAAGRAALDRGDYAAMAKSFEVLSRAPDAAYMDAVWHGHSLHLAGQWKEASDAFQRAIELADRRLTVLDQLTGPEVREDPNEEGSKSSPVQDWRKNRDRELERIQNDWPKLVLLAGRVQLWQLEDARRAARTFARGLRFAPEAVQLDKLTEAAAAALKEGRNRPHPLWFKLMIPIATQRELAVAHAKLGDMEAAANCWARVHLSYLAYKVGMAHVDADQLVEVVSRVAPAKRQPFHELVLQNPGSHRKPKPREYDYQERLTQDARNPFQVAAKLDGFQMTRLGPSRASLAKLPDGRWIMAFTGGDEFQSRIYLSTSVDGKTWDAPWEFSHNNIFPTRCPSLVVDDDGLLWMLCSSKRLDLKRFSSGEYRLWLCSSRDGRAWSGLRPIKRSFHNSGQYQQTAHMTRDRRGKFWVVAAMEIGSADSPAKLRELQPLKLAEVDGKRVVSDMHVSFDETNRCHLTFSADGIFHTSSQNMRDWAAAEKLAGKPNASIKYPQSLTDGKHIVAIYETGRGGWLRSGTIEANRVAWSDPVHIGMRLGGSLVARDGDRLLLTSGPIGNGVTPILLAARVVDAMNLSKQRESVIEDVADEVIVFNDGRVIATDSKTKYVRLNGKREQPAQRKELKAGVRVRYEIAPGKAASKVIILPAKQVGATVPAKGLEFLKPYPKLHGLSLNMTEKQFLAIVKKHGLKAKKKANGDSNHYSIPADDDHDVIVMFGNNGDKCSGIQRVRGDNRPAGSRAMLKPVAGRGSRAGRGSPDPALFPTEGLPNSDEKPGPANNANGDLRSNSAAGSGDPRRARQAGPQALLKPAFLLPGHYNMMDVRFDDKGKELVSISAYHFATVRKSDVLGRKLKGEIKLASDKPFRPFRAATFRLSGDGRHVVAATDEYVGIWNSATGELLKKLSYPTKKWEYDCIGKLDCTSDLSVIVGQLTTSYSGTAMFHDAHLIVWDGKTGEVLNMVVDKRANRLLSIDLSTDGKRLATTHGAGARVWETRTGKLLRSFANNNKGRKHSDPEVKGDYNDQAWSVQLSPNGKQLAVGDILGARLWDIESGKLQHQLDASYRYSNGKAALIYSKDGQMLARTGTSGKGKKVVPIWSTATGKKVFELQVGSNCGAFSNDNKQFAVGYSDRQKALAVFQLSGVAAEPPAQPTSNANTPGGLRYHHRGKKAEELIAQWKPVWGEEQLGVRYGIAFSSKQRQFRIGQRVPMMVFFRNVSDKPLQVDVRPDFIWEVPKVTGANGAAIEVERVALLGSIPHYRETLKPGEAFGAIYLSIGLGENPRPGQQDWAPYWKMPAAGPYKLTHTIAFKVAGPNSNSNGKSPDWKPGKLTTGKLDFEIVVGPHPPARNQADKPVTAIPVDPPVRPKSDGVQAVLPRLEFRFVAQAADSKTEPRAPADFAKRDYSGNSVIGRIMAKDKGFIWVQAATSNEIAQLPAERLRGGKVREVLLADTPEHALTWNGKWSVENCQVVPAKSVGPVEHFSIEMKLNEVGGKALLALTTTHLNQHLAIVVDGQIIAAPIVRGVISRHIVISGNFNRAQADKLAKAIRGAQAANEGAAKVDANGEIVGRLIDALTGKPVEGATIACGAVITNSKKRGGANAVTDAEGRYRMPVPAPGIYNVWLKKYDQDTSMTAAADDGILVEAGKAATSELSLVVGRRVTGKVVDTDGKTYANVGLSSYSAARPFAGGVQSVKTNEAGTFEFSLPPGRAYVYINPSVRVDQQGPRLSARAYFDVSKTKDFEPITLTLKESKQKFGDPEWLKRSTPGTQIIRHEDKKDVTGTVVDESGKPVAGAKTFSHDGPIVTVNDQGKFRIQVRKGTQFLMHAFSPGYHVWTGAPTSGDVLKIVLEKKRVHVIDEDATADGSEKPSTDR